jgi:hypothetical protein
MPGDDCFRFHEDKSGAPVGPDVRQPRPEKSVRGSKSGTVGNGASEDVDLVMEGNDLDLESGRVFTIELSRVRRTSVMQFLGPPDQEAKVNHSTFGISGRDKL